VSEDLFIRGSEGISKKKQSKGEKPKATEREDAAPHVRNLTRPRRENQGLYKVRNRERSTTFEKKPAKEPKIWRRKTVQQI